MPDIIIVGGPNGAGKTSFANAYLPQAGTNIVYVNADEIARDLEPLNLSDGIRNLRAGRLMLDRLDELAAARAEFMFETTLATRTYANRISRWRQRGYRTTLIYLRLPNVEASLQRVAKRVALGGHGIPDATIRRRFQRSLEYLEIYYKPIVDEWHIWDSVEGDFRFVEARGDDGEKDRYGKFEAALKRAARVAVSGSKEERSGRFLPRDTAKRSGDKGASPATSSSAKKA